MKKLISNCSGSISPFLIIVLTSLIILIFGLIDIYKISDAKSRLHLCGLIGINSTMADFNYELKKDYGLYAFVYQNKFEIENEILNNIKNNINCFGLNKTSVDSVEIINSIDLTNKEELINQIRKKYLDDLVDDAIDYFLYDDNEIDSIINEKSKVVSKDEYENISNYAELDNRDEIKQRINKNDNNDIVIDEELTNNITFNNISFDNANEDSKSLLSKIKNISTAADNLIINKYIFDTFDYLTNDNEINREKVFKDEIEFILEGYNSQNKNISGVKNKILVLFYPEKLKEVYMDLNKKEEAELIAEAVCGWWATEIGVTIVKNLILNAWAYDEANNEYEKLKNGERVYSKLLMKEVNYKDLLNIFLLIQNKNTKIENMIKLIDINMKKYNCFFSMETSFSKLEIEIKAKEKMQFMTRKCIWKEMRFTDEIEIKERCSYGF